MVWYGMVWYGMDKGAVPLNPEPLGEHLSFVFLSP